MDEVDFTILAATSVFTDLISKCPPAEACREAFDRTAKATIKMANSTGGFGQVLGRKKRGSRGNNDYLSSRDANRQRHNQRISDAATTRSSTQYDTPSYDGYSNQRATQTTPSQASGYRLPISTTQAEDTYPMLRTMPTTALSTGSGSDVGSVHDNSAIDPVLLPSPGPVQSPASAASMTPQSTQASQYPQATPGSNFNLLQSPSSTYAAPAGGVNYSDLQGMDFLQGLQDPASANYGNPDLQMDMGFGLGWEGMHHDFSDGQQVDLFDGFFFGGQQGGGMN